MTTLLRPTKDLYNGGRTRLHKTLLRSQFGTELSKSYQTLSSDWPVLARSINEIKASRRVPRDLFAHSRVGTLSTVSGSIYFSRAALSRWTTSLELLGYEETKYSLAASMSDVFVHEWGHLLFSIEIYRRYPDYQKGLADFVSVLEEASGVSCEEAAESLSFMSTLNHDELLAESFLAANKGSRDPFPQACLSFLRTAWDPDQYLCLPYL